MATFAEMKAERERRERDQKELLARYSASSPVDPCLQYTLSSGTRCTISGIFDSRLQITCAGGNPWAEEAGVTFLTLGMLSVEDLREFLEIRMVVEAFKAGRLAELPMPKQEFDRWVCPPGFVVPLLVEGYE